MPVFIKTATEIIAMRESGRILGAALAAAAAAVQPGVTTLELERVALAKIKEMGGEPAFLGFGGFPAGLCSSVNDALVHGIPGERALQEGDIVGIDCGVSYQGLVTDAAVTVAVGRVSSDTARLLAGTEGALAAAVAIIRDGVTLRAVAEMIESSLHQARLSVAPGLCGHGVGRSLHEEPEIANSVAAAGRGILRAGMTIAVEPMATLGGRELLIDDDGWTYRTVDGSYAAQFEHTLLVTPLGCEILTGFPG